MQSDDALVVQAHDLRIAIGLLARRMRQVYALNRGRAEASFTETAVLNRLERDGPASPGALANREKVTSQAIAAVISELERRALVTREPDPADGRKAIVRITDAGRAVLNDHEQAVMEAVIKALDTSFTHAERAVLQSAVPLLTRLAEAL